MIFIYFKRKTPPLVYQVVAFYFINCCIPLVEFYQEPYLPMPNEHLLLISVLILNKAKIG